MSMFIAIEGLDGSGKSTQINLLIKKFEAEGKATRFVHFPRLNQGIFGELIASFLRGEYGAVNAVHPQLVALLFAEDRKQFAETIQGWLAEGCYVLVDRYVLSNIAFQCAKTKDEHEKEKLRQWINMFEYEFQAIPKPDLSFYLEVPFEFTQRALNAAREGEQRNYLKGKEDIHEKDLELQYAVRKEYEQILEMDESIVKVTCCDEHQQIKSIKEIHELILDILETKLTIKANGVF
ncbi:dTMP kinase [Mucilaginibacter segetis]|uniref:Thymidylate kinase n=1 Tax=Mucilaginibacter segetis TaxID=2793071 RepID=A0A934PRA1_9SPHI|nr:dTMP kinase [Mucilaginibacter segetis]MBK0379323.1 dTMP kinase [Mucilaginibacter segetis]